MRNRKKKYSYNRRKILGFYVCRILQKNCMVLCISLCTVVERCDDRGEYGDIARGNRNSNIL
jgi:hypothetical protein